MPDRDGDGYPSDEELLKVRNWPSDDPVGWLAYIKSIWNYADWGWTEQGEIQDANHQVYRYYVSTGGWSGNESIIHEMLNTRTLWQQTWVQHRPGGHYIFEVSA